MTKKTNKEVVKKPNSAIHIDSKKLKLRHRKIMNILLWNFYKVNDPSQEIYYVPLDLVSYYLMEKKRNDEDLIKLIKELSDITIQWDLLHDGKRNIGFTRFISDACLKYDENTNYEKMVQYSIPPLMRELLEDRERFTVLNLDVMKLFKTKYAAALYENCVRFLAVGTTGWRSVDTWKQMIGYEGKYSYKHFNQHVLQVAIKEINDLSDIDLEMIPEKNGRKVVKIKFIITSKLAKLPDFLTSQMFEIINVVDPEKRKEELERFIEDLKADSTMKKYLNNIKVQDFLTQMRLDDVEDAIVTVVGPGETEKLKKDANECYKKSGYGNCSSRWSDFSDKLNKACHWCKKFDDVREAKKIA